MKKKEKDVAGAELSEVALSAPAWQREEEQGRKRAPTTVVVL